MKEKRPFLYTFSFAIVLTITTIAILCVGYIFTKRLTEENSSTPLPVFNENNKTRFVIDAGHGGEDAGAVACDGTLEKDLNLDISKLIFTILELNGEEVILTRDKDTLLYDYYNDLEDYKGQKKVYDLKNRLKLAEEKENSIYIGIHMNKFSATQYSGLQIYYSKNTDESKKIATDIRNSVISHLQPNNKRQLKNADSSIYILHNAKIPAVLIECGFLSNEEELKQLKNSDYQKELALSLFTSLIKY